MFDWVKNLFSGGSKKSPSSSSAGTSKPLNLSGSPKGTLGAPDRPAITDDSMAQARAREEAERKKKEEEERKRKAAEAAAAQAKAQAAAQAQAAAKPLQLAQPANPLAPKPVVPILDPTKLQKAPAAQKPAATVAPKNNKNPFQEAADKVYTAAQGAGKVVDAAVDTVKKRQLGVLADAARAPFQFGAKVALEKGVLKPNQANGTYKGKGLLGEAFFGNEELKPYEGVEKSGRNIINQAGSIKSNFKENTAGENVNPALALGAGILGVGSELTGFGKKPVEKTIEKVTKEEAAKTVAQEAGTLVKATKDDVSKIPIVSDKPATPTEKVEIAPGVKVAADNTPAYQRRAPSTVGDAAVQERFGQNNIPDEALDADARAAADATDPMNTDLDVPTYQRKNADALEAEAAAKVATFDDRLKGIDSTLPTQARKFDDRVAIANAYKESPEKGKAMEALINSRNNRLDPEAALKEAIVGRSDAARDLETAQRAKAAEARLSQGGSDAIRIPDPLDGPALQKVDEVVDTGEIPMANFRNSVNGSELLEKMPTQANVADDVAQGDLRIDTSQTPQGNPTLQSDAQVAQELADKGITPDRGGSPVDAQEQNFDRAAGSQDAAPRTYERMAEQIEDPAVRDEMLQSFPQTDKINLAEAQAQARNSIAKMTDEDLVTMFRNGIDVSTPQGYYQAIYTAGRLGRTDVIKNVEGAREVAQIAADAAALRASEGGKILRTTQILFENMPPIMKRDTLLKTLGKAGVEMQDADRELFLRLIERSDEADGLVKELQDEATSIAADIKNNPGGANVDELAARYDSLSKEFAAAKEKAQIETANTVKFYDAFKERGSITSQAADIGRGLMLSGVGGRVFDNLSTAASAFNDVTQANASALIGKAVNKVKGDGQVIDSFMSPKTLVKGTLAGAREVADSFRGKGRKDVKLESFLKKEDNRSGVADSNGFNRFINNVVDIPTKLSRGIEDARIEQVAKQEAEKLGLPDAEAGLYAKFQALVPSETQKADAIQMHMKTNNLHENWIRSSLEGITRSLAGTKLFKENPNLQGIADALIKNQIAPFTSFLAGNLHRAITDKNIAYNVVKAGLDLKKGNLQGFTDQIGNLAVNSTQAMGVGYVLSQMGYLTDTDANGDGYAGVYLHVGDRYIPISILGAAATPIILGQAVQSSAADAENPGEMVQNALGRAVTNTLASAGVASVFGGENSVQQTFSALTKGDGDNVFDPMTKYASNVLRQYLNPAIFGDINAGANNGLPFGLSPNATGEAAQVDVTGEDGKKNILMTELNRLMAGVPGLSQTLERNPDKQAPDFLDRGLKSTRETGAAKETRETKEVLAASKKQLEKDGVPTEAEDIEAFAKSGEYDKAIQGAQYRLSELEGGKNVPESRKQDIRDQITRYSLERDGIPTDDDGVKAANESGDYDNAIKGAQYQLSKIENDEKVPESKKQKIRDQIKKTEITRDNNFTPDVVKMYGEISESEWRAAGDPDSDDYDPDLYNVLKAYDDKLAGGGVSGSSRGGDKNKYRPKTGGSGRGGRNGSGIPSLNFSAATNDISFSPQKLQKLDASFNTPQSAIPMIQRVQNNDTSKMRKVKVTKGVL